MASWGKFTDDAPELAAAGWPGDAKLAGRAIEVTDPETVEQVLRGDGREAPPGPAHVVRLDITEAVRIAVEGSPPTLVIESWHPGRGVRPVERD